MARSTRFRARRLVTAGFLTAGLALVGPGAADAGSGTTPSKIEIDFQSAVTGVTQAWAIHAGGAPVLVYQLDAASSGNPKGISIIRGGNHKVTTNGAQLELGRVAGDEDGSIAMVYRAGLQSHTRVVKPDNTLAFDIYRPADRLAGIATDGEGGAYLVTHASFKPEGSVLADHTKHTTVRYSPTGTVLWEVAQPPVPGPYTVPQHRSVAAKSGLGVFVGYAVEGRSNQPKPILLHQAKADGAVIFAQSELKGPKLTAGKIVQGDVGTGELEGLIEHVVAASDGSVLAVVHDHGHEQYVIRVDANGQQTATFVCDGKAEPIQPNEIACIDRHAGLASFTFSRYGIVDGDLQRTVGEWDAPKKAGRTYGEIAGMPGRQLLVEVKENDQLQLLLLSKQGAVMVQKSAAVEHGISALGANATSWVGAGSTWVLRGTVKVGSNVKPTQALPGVQKIPR